MYSSKTDLRNCSGSKNELMIFCVDFLSISSLCARFYLNDLSVLGLNVILLVDLKLIRVCTSLNGLWNEFLILCKFYLLLLLFYGFIDICD